jgi:hypothetical protein
VIWVALWTVLLLGAGALLGTLGLDVYRKGRALMADVSEASERLGEAAAPLQEATEELEERREELAVFSDPAELRRARAKAAKGKGGANSGQRLGGRHRSAAGTPNRFGATSQGSTRPRRERTT